jgi:hypothetical protein
LLPTLAGNPARGLPMRASHTTRSVFAAAAVAVALASLGSVREAGASPQSGTAPGVAVWFHSGRGAQLVRNGGLAVALVRARDTANRLEWSGRAPAPLTATRQAATRTSGAPAPKPALPAGAPDSAANGSSDSRSRLLDSRGNDHRHRERLPDARASLDPSQDRRSLGARARSAPTALRLTAGEAVFHDAHAPPAQEQSLDGRLS